MPPFADITFDCVPLRSLNRFDAPPNASPGLRELYTRIGQAVEKHGLHNTYYLHNARCVFHLTNDPQIGMLEFAFEGTVLTDPDDRRTLRSDLRCELRHETCDWLTEPIVDWFGETVARAVILEFDRYIAEGDLAITIQRIEQLEATQEAQGGYLGMGL
jgi:hypothetical protein